VQGSNPVAKHHPEAHGLEDTVEPLDGHSIVGVEEVQAEQKARHTTAMQILRRRQDGGGTIKDRTTRHRT
jgi:hypothetical protein